jgi:segregation and condensation protein B
VSQLSDSHPDHPLGLDQFVRRPGDEGLPLESLAGTTEQGLDPYAEEPDVQETGEESHRCATTPRSILEAILFVGHPTSEGVSSRYIASLLRGVRPAEVDQLVAELNQEYADAGCPYHIVSVTTGYRLALREEYSGIREGFYGKLREAKLSQAAIDALAVVAYHQPIERESLREICDTVSPALLAQLVRRGLLVVERHEGSKQWQYTTSARFLEMFGLETLKDLPRAQDA